MSATAIAPPPRRVRAALLVIGDEILSGRTQETNLRTLAQFLGPLGVSLAEARVVADDPGAIKSAVRALASAYDYVFTTGGIGPTHDDITADAIAAAFDAALDEHPEALALLGAHYAEQDFTPARRRMARLPHGARLIRNKVSTAPGFMVRNVFVLAGVPMVMRAMLEEIAPWIEGGAVTHAIEIRGPRAREGLIAAPLEAIAKARPNLSFGSYPYYADSDFGACVVARGTDLAELTEARAAVEAMFRDLGVTIVV